MNRILISIVNPCLGKARRGDHPCTVRDAINLLVALWGLKTLVLKLILLSPNTGCWFMFTVACCMKKLIIFHFLIQFRKVRSSPSPASNKHQWPQLIQLCPLSFSFLLSGEKKGGVGALLDQLERPSNSKILKFKPDSFNHQRNYLKKKE